MIDEGPEPQDDARRTAARRVAARLAAAQAAGWRAYAVVDTAAGEHVPAAWELMHALFEAGADARCLYEGALAESLKFSAPWLVTLGRPDGTREQAPDGPGREGADGAEAADAPAHVTEALWGRGCALFLLSAAPPAVVRRHLRRLLLVRLVRADLPADAHPELVPWRFYDPLVWRVTVPALPAPDQVRVFGPVAEALGEGETPDVLVVAQGRAEGDERRSVARVAWRTLAVAGPAHLVALPPALPYGGPEAPASSYVRAAAAGAGGAAAPPWPGALVLREADAEPLRPVMRATAPERLVPALRARRLTVTRAVDGAPEDGPAGNGSAEDGAAAVRVPDLIAADPRDGTAARVAFHQAGVLAGLPHTFTTAGGRRAAFAHAARDGRLVGVERPGGRVLAVAADADGDLTRVAGVATLDDAVAAAEDDHGGSAVGATALAVTYARVGPPGRERKVPVRLAYADGTAQAADYDLLGRLARAVDRTGAATTFAWHGDTGHLAAVVDPLGRRTAVEIDAEGRLAALTLPDGRRTTFAADAPDPGPLDTAAAEAAWAGAVHGVAECTRADGSVVALGLDAFGHVRVVAHPDGTRTTYALDPMSGAVSAAVRTDADGAERSRVVLTLAGGAVVGEAVTGPALPAGEGVREGAADASAYATSTGATVDDAGRLVTRTTAFGDALAYQYDADGLLTGVRLPARWGAADTASASEADGGAGGRLIYFWRGPQGEVTAVDYARELQEHRAHDPASGRVTDATLVVPGRLDDALAVDDPAYAARYEAAVLARRGWDYDALGGCTGWRDAWRAGLDRPWREAGRAILRDAEQRVTGEDDAATGRPVARWARNAAGDLMALARAVPDADAPGGERPEGDGLVPDGLAPTPVGVGASGEPMAWGGAPVAYDTLGRVTRLPAAVAADARSASAVTCTWGADGTLAEALALGAWATPNEAGDALVGRAATRRGMRRWRYGYDALGRRAWKTDGRRTWRYGWAGPQLVTEEYTEAPPAPVVRPPLAGVPEPEPVRRRRTYVWAGDTLTLLAFYDETLAAGGVPRGDGRLHWVQSDTRGAVTHVYAAGGPEVAAPGAAPRLVWHATYDGFGVADVDVAAVAQPWRLLGQYADDAEGDTGLYHSLARYYSPHTGHYLSRDPLWPGVDTTPYSYAGHRAWDAADPTGAMPLPLIAIGVGALVGAAAGGVTAAMSGKSILAGAAGGAVLGAGAVVAGIAAAAVGVGALATLALEGLGTAAAGTLAALTEQGVAGESLCLPCAFKAGGVAGALTVLTLGVGRIPAVQRFAGRMAAMLGESRVGLWARAAAGRLADAARRVGVQMSERFAAREAARLETLDGGHSLARHGSDVSDAALDARVRTGIAPNSGGKVSATRAATRFNSNRDWVQTRDAGLDDIASRRSVDLSQPPGPGDPLRYDVVTEHGRPIDDGFVGVGPAVKVPNPANPANTIKVWPNTTPVSGLTRTFTKVEWDAAAARWKVVQHFPSADGWDQGLGLYTTPVPP